MVSSSGARWRAFWFGQPELVLLDEPFSALDAYLKWQVELELSGHPEKIFSCGTLFVTHNRDEVLPPVRYGVRAEQGKVRSEGDSQGTVSAHRQPWVLH